VQETVPSNPLVALHGFKQNASPSNLPTTPVTEARRSQSKSQMKSAAKYLGTKQLYGSFLRPSNETPGKKPELTRANLILK
jgi:hypothetical protein